MQGLKRFLSTAGGLTLLVLGLAAASAVALRFETVTAFGQEAALSRAAGLATGSIVDSGTGFAVVSARKPHLAAELYMNGAWFVVPGDLAGPLKAVGLKARAF